MLVAVFELRMATLSGNLVPTISFQQADNFAISTKMGEWVKTDKPAR